MISSDSPEKKNDFGLHIISILFAVAFCIIIIFILCSKPAVASTPLGFAIDTAPSLINESSEPIDVLNITIWDSDTPTLLSINVTVQNLSSFHPDFDLAPLTGDKSSGVMIYRETNGQTDFQFNDTPVGITPTSWIINGPGRWQTTFLGINDTLSPTLNFYYVVIRTSPTISDNETFMVGIRQNHVVTDHGNIPQTGDNWTSPIDIDTQDPSPTVTIISDDDILKIGDSINITAEFMDTDIKSVTVDLSDFNGLSTLEPMTYDPIGLLWFYNLTGVEKGSIDTGPSGYPFKVTATDSAENKGVGTNSSHSVDIIEPTISAYVDQENSRAGIGQWINISVATDPDVISVQGDLKSFSGLGNSETFEGSGANWWYNFTVNTGTLDGMGPIVVTVFDDAGYSNINDTESALVDEISPSVGIIVTQKNYPAGIGDWINITVITHSDVLMVEADLASAGVSGQSDGQSFFKIDPIKWFYNFTIIPGSSDYTLPVPLDISVIDHANNANSSSGNIQFDEVSPEPVGVNIIYESGGSRPAKFGDWINISVDMGVHTDIVSLLLDAPGIFDSEPIINSFGNILYLNTTVPLASFDGLVDFTVTSEDDGGNVNTISKSVNVNTVDDPPQSIINWFYRADTMNITFSLSGDEQNKLLWEIYEHNTLFTQGDITKSASPFDTHNLNLHMDRAHDYEIRLYYSSSNAGNNTIAVTFEVNGLVYTIFHEFDSQDQNSNQLSIPFKDVLEPIGVVTLDGSSSFDPDEDIVNYEWYIDGLLVGSEKLHVHYFPENGNYEATLKVISDGRQFSESSTTITIENYKKGTSREDIISKMAALTFLKDAKMNALFIESSTSDLLVYDAQANRIGEVEGEFVSEIAHAQTIIIIGSTRIYFIPNDLDLTSEITAIEDGVYDLGFLTPENGYLKMSMFLSYINKTELDTYFLTGDLNTFNINTHRKIMVYNLTLKNTTDDTEKTFNVKDMELGEDESHEYEVVNWGTIEDEEGAVHLRIDEDSDGEIEHELDLKNGMTGVDVQNSLSIKPGRSPVGLPFEIILLFGFVVSLSAATAVFLLTEIGKMALFYYLYLLYTRIKKEYILDNFTRGEIFGYIKANPGVHFSEIKRALELKNGSLAYHIKALEKRELIVSKIDRGYKRFYPKTIKLPERNIRELIPVQRNIMQIVKENPGISQTSISEKLDVSFQLVHYHVKILRDADYLIFEKDGKQTYCYDADYNKHNKNN
jgi:predicted transcriptional regulator